MIDKCIECDEPTHGSRKHCSSCSPTFGPYDVVTTFMFKKQADEFIAAEVKKLTTFPWCMVALHPEEAERITRKNAVVYAHNFGDEFGYRAERLFDTKDPRR